MGAFIGDPGASTRGDELLADEELRILILAPIRNDARLSAHFLEQAGFAVAICKSLEELSDRVRRGCGALLLAEEALTDETVSELVTALAGQPSWSDLPLIMITPAGEAARVRPRCLAALNPVGNISIIERPVRPETLVSTCEVALRSRRRQYQVRDLLSERERLVANAVEQSRVFDTTLSSIADFAYTLDHEGRFIYANRALLNLWGLKLADAVGRNFWDLSYPPELAARLHQQIRHVFETGEVVRDETPYTSPTGVDGFYEYIFSPVFGSDGTVTVVAGSTRDTSARRRNEEALREADRRKDEFLAMLAHELRNPLAAVANAASLLTSPNGEDQNWAAGVIARQSGQLAHLIDDLLDVSRITTGKIRLRKEIIDVATILDRARDSAAPLVNARKHELLCSYSSGFMWVEADPTRLEQIVLNLLTNAAKYTPSGGRIELTARLASEEIQITVRDNGMGIPPDRMPEMFQLFAQGERSIARSEGGLGIGLTIVQKLVELHHGRIDAYSDGLNRGSTFTVCFPVASQSPAKNRVEPEAGQGGNSLRVLIVDDNVDTAQGLARLLARTGHRTLVAHDGLQALEQARGKSPDAIVLDIGLPGMDGFQLVRRLRAESSCANALIVAVTGYGQPEDRARAMEAGFDHHLVKPINFKELKALLQKKALGMVS
jgi:PAS domain S-box-containing protein